MGARPDNPLSARQHEILKLIALGRSNKEIAHQLRLSTGTVKQHIYALFRKLGVTNRTTAVIRGAQRLNPETTHSPSRAPAEALAPPGVPEELRYTRRLVTAVVVEPRPEPVRSARQAARIEKQLAQLRERIALLAFAFDASSEPLPGGGVAAWFGQRVAHGDDAARAVAFARALPPQVHETDALPCAIGLGTVPEVVGEEQRSSLAFRAFRVATLLASFGEPHTLLACETTTGLAGLPPQATRQAAHQELPVAARIIAPEAAASSAVAEEWGGLPFIAEVEAAVGRGASQWVAIESWPPEDGTRLIRAIGESLGARGFPVYSLWLPSPASAGSLNDRLIGQLQQEFARRGRKLAAHRLEDALLEIAADGRAVLLAYGLDALPTLRDALPPTTLERARTIPLAVAGGAMRRSGEPQTAIRLLGSHPAAAVFSRVLRMTVPAAGAAHQGMRADVQAVLDRVSPLARALARVAAETPLADVAALAASLGSSADKVAAGCRELEQAGIAVLQEGKLRFRDEGTSEAVRASLVARRA